MVVVAYTMNIDHNLCFTAIAQNINPVLMQGCHTKIAVAVSGGADSMALCIALHTWSKDKNLDIVGLTVDHQLRPQSMQESQQVHQWLSQHGIEHHILTWSHPPLTSGIQEKARKARYKLLQDFCERHQIQILCTAHHLQDQIETFLMRLSKGSGLDGLCVMRPHVKRDNLMIIRPFLALNPEVFEDFLKGVQQDHITDPSNDNDAFERVKWRQVLKYIAEKGLSMDYFPQSLKRLQSDNQFIDETIDDLWDDIASIQENSGKMNIVNLLQLHECLATRMLAKAFQIISGKPYSAPYEKMLDIFSQL
ncbi:MAG: tRNA lysidine(34) synthetase TilS, partial [Alphaproteobacteria bacterium]|nr:tRNA lysidine(34) synthetase TilS [Alphaproteobacteria bacterium]